MKKNVLFGGMALAFITVFVFLPIHPAQAAVSSWEKGVTMVPQTQDDLGSADTFQSLKNLAATGANFVAFEIPYYQNVYNSSVLFAGSDTPTDQALTTAIQEAHSLGMKVQIAVYPNSQDTGWRALIDPTNRITWFQNYGAILDHYAAIAQQNNVEQFVLGAELIKLTRDDYNPQNTPGWLSVIAGVRAVYSGKITYFAQWANDSSLSDFQDEKDAIAFWPELDFVGITEYNNIGDASNPQALLQGWATVEQQEDLVDFAKKYNKPFLFGEIGYINAPDAGVNPWNWGLTSESDDEAAQANLYNAFFTYWNSVPQVSGVFLWNWSASSTYGGSGNMDYTPQGKQAQNVMAQWFGGQQSSVGGAPVPSQSSGTFSATVTQPQQITPNQSSVLQVSITGTGASQNVVTDLEIYNAAGQQVYQTFSGNQSFVQNQPQSYPITWTPSAAGTYTIKFGIFSSDWSKNYFWNNGLTNVAVGNVTPPTPPQQPPQNPVPPPASYQINNWWPVDTAQMSGTQPFKAMIDNLDASQYTMYWQVDGDQLNLMPDNSTVVAHKEADVDLSGWNWSSNGQYTITFIAKNSSGTVIASKNITITVTH